MGLSKEKVFQAAELYYNKKYPQSLLKWEQLSEETKWKYFDKITAGIINFEVWKQEVAEREFYLDNPEIKEISIYYKYLYIKRLFVDNKIVNPKILFSAWHLYCEENPDYGNDYIDFWWELDEKTRFEYLLKQQKSKKYDLEHFSINFPEYDKNPLCTQQAFDLAILVNNGITGFDKEFRLLEYSEKLQLIKTAENILNPVTENPHVSELEEEQKPKSLQKQYALRIKNFEVGELNIAFAKGYTVNRISKFNDSGSMLIILNVPENEN